MIRCIHIHVWCAYTQQFDICVQFGCFKQMEYPEYPANCCTFWEHDDQYPIFRQTHILKYWITGCCSLVRIANMSIHDWILIQTIPSN